MNNRIEPPLPRFHLPNHAWLTASKVGPDVSDDDRLNTDKKRKLVLVRVRPKLSWYRQVVPSPERKKESNRDVAAAARDRIATLSWRTTQGDEEAACALAELVSDAVGALTRHAEKRPGLFHSYTAERWVWPILRNKQERITKREEKLFNELGLGEKVAIETLQFEYDTAGKIAIALTECLEEARLGSKDCGILTGPCKAVGDMKKTEWKTGKSEECGDWWPIAEKYLLDAYPHPERVREFRDLVDKNRKLTDGRARVRILERIRKRFGSRAPR